MKLTGVGGVFCASHSPGGCKPHGHTWQVIVWFPMGEDADVLRDYVQKTLKEELDHTHLPDHIAWSENLAEWLGTFYFPDAVRIQCNRPLEHIYAEWTR